MPDLESEIQRVGRALHEAFPSASRHPVRALDSRAMGLASQDHELRAALFRLVDVTPACRSLDDLARHLTGYLEEVHDRSSPLDAAMRMGGNRAGRTALGQRPPPGCATWRTASSWARAPARPRIRCASCGTTARPRRSTCSARPP